MLIIQLITFAAVTVWCIRYYETTTGLAQGKQERPPRESLEAEAEPPKIDRVKLEQIAANCLAATNCSFDTYYYLRNKTDIELMDIIKDFNLKYNYE